MRCSYEHLIVDNASTDGTVEWIEKWQPSSVRLFKNTKNEGFSSANNRALKKAKGKYILFLNPDMEIREGTLDALMKWMDQCPDVGLASCRLLNAAGQSPPFLRPHRFPHFLPYVASFLCLNSFFCTIHPKFFYPDFDDMKQQAVDVVRGAFMLTRRQTLDQLGFAFDPKYFLLFEDVDLCREIKNLGLQVMYTPQMSCIDYFGRSFVEHPPFWKYLRMAQSFTIYVRKWHSSFHLVWLVVLIPIGFLLRMGKWWLYTGIRR